MDLGKLADMADKVMEVAVPTVAAIPSSTATNSLDVQQLRQEVARLAELVTSLTTSLRHGAPLVMVAPLLPHVQTTRPSLRSCAGIMPSLGKTPKSARSPAPGRKTTLQLWIQVILPPVTFFTSLTYTISGGHWIRSQCHSPLCFRSKKRTRHAQFDSRQQRPHSHIWETITDYSTSTLDFAVLSSGYSSSQTHADRS